MKTLAVNVTPDLDQRLTALAGEIGKTVDECLSLAVREFVDAWETHLADIHQIDEHEARAVLKAVNE